MSATALDRRRIAQALALAHGSIGLSEPNPRVGCVIGDETGQVFGQGATQEAGGAHAEIMALRDAAGAGTSVEGATAWVTLEPCSHFGRTPPCCDALIAAGIRRCVTAVADPNPVAGAGLARLRAAGVDVAMLDDPDLARQARELNIGFFSRMQRGRPWLRLKLAASLDGRLALPDGRSRWITGEAARADGHVWRKRASAVMTGIGTVLADDPRLDVRAVATAHQPLRIVLDTRLRLPPQAAIVRPPGSVLLVSATGEPARKAALVEAGVEVWDDWQGGGAPALAALLARLTARGINELHLEAGPTLAGAFLTAGLVDELLLYVAPMLIGPGQPLAALPELRQLADADRYQWTACDRVGNDMRFRLIRMDGGSGAESRF